jgi:WD40 repeat protein
LSAPATAIACSDDGEWLAVGDTHGGVALFATADGSPGARLASMLGAAVSALRFSRDGARIAAGGRWTGQRGPAMLQVWRVDDGQPLAAVQHRHPVVDIDFDPAGERIVSSSDSAAYVWSLGDGTLLKRLGQHTNVWRARFDTTGGQLVLASGDGAVSVWNATTLERTLELRHQGPVFHAVFSDDGRFVLSASNDGTARLWRIADGTEQLRFAHDHFLSAAGFSPDGTRILTAARDGRVRLWQAAPPARTLLPVASGARITDDGAAQAEATGPGQWQLRWLDADRPPFPFATTSGVLRIAVSADRRYLAAGRFDGHIDLWSLDDARLLRQLTLPAPADTLGFSPDGAALLAGARDGSVRLWSVAGGTLRWQRQFQGLVMTHAFSADGRLVASGGSDRLAHIMHAQDGREMQALPHGHDVRGLAFGPDGGTLASASSDRQARLWQVDNGKELRRLPHQFPVLAIAFDTSGTRIATGASDDTARIWNAASGAEVSRIDTPDAVLALGFTADGRLRVHTGSELELHEVDGDALSRAACARLTRDLGAAAWARHIGNEAPRPICPAKPPATG